MFEKSLILPVLLILSIWCFQIPPLATTLLALLLYKLFTCFSHRQNMLCSCGSLEFAGTWQNKGAQMPEQFPSLGKMPSLWMGNEGVLLRWKWCLCPRAIGFKLVLPNWDLSWSTIFQACLCWLKPRTIHKHPHVHKGQTVLGHNTSVFSYCSLCCVSTNLWAEACMDKHSCEAVLRDVVWRSIWSRLTSSWKQVQMAEKFWKCSCTLLNWASVGMPQRVKSHFSI